MLMILSCFKSKNAEEYLIIEKFFFSISSNFFKQNVLNTCMSEDPTFEYFQLFPPSNTVVKNFMVTKILIGSLLIEKKETG